MQESKSTPARQSGFLRTVSAVLWSFFGVRRGRDHEQDMAQLNPVHVIITGVIAGLLFVLSLVVLVRFVLSSVSS